MKRSRPIMLLILLSIMLSTSICTGRMWTNRNGRTLEADFIALKDGKVQVKRTSDGKLFEVPLESLSDADQAYVRTQTQLKVNETIVPQATANAIWGQTKIAKLTLSLGNLLGDSSVDTAAKLNESQFPPLPFQGQRVQEHLAKAAVAATQKNLQLARQLAVSDYALSLTLSTSMTMYLFADREDEWPKDGSPIKVRVHGRRIFSMYIPTLLENAGGIKGPYASDDILGAAIDDEIKKLKQKDKHSMEDNYDLLLVGERIDANGIVRGRVSGKLPDKSIINDVSFTLTPVGEDGKPLKQSPKSPE